MAVVSHNAIFIHIYKAGGTSVRRMFDLVRIEECVGAHVVARRVRSYLKAAGRYDEWRRKFKFATVRNPYALLVSLYNYIRVKPQHAEHVNALRPFEEFIDWLIDERIPRGLVDGVEYTTQRDFIYEGDTQLLDYVGRVECMPHVAKTVARHLGTRTPRVIRANAFNHPPWRECMTPRALRRINETFAEDFETFGYTRVTNL